MMVKGVLLAWLLCRQKRIFNAADDYRIISALGVYRREEGEETVNTRQTIVTQSITWRYAVPGVT